MKAELVGELEEMFVEGCSFDAFEDDEEAGEHDEKGPVDLFVDAFGMDAAGDEEKRAGDHGGFGDGNSGEKGDEEKCGGGERFPEEKFVDFDGVGGDFELSGGLEFLAVEEDDDGDGEERTEESDGGKAEEELGVGDLRVAADHHVLRVAGDGGDGSDIGGDSDSNEVRQRAAVEGERDFEDEGRHDEAHGVVDEQGAEDGGGEDDGGEQCGRVMGTAHNGLAGKGEEAA